MQENYYFQVSGDNIEQKHIWKILLEKTVVCKDDLLFFILKISRCFWSRA